MMTLDRRPRKFSEVVGQKTIINQLINYTKDDRTFPQVMMMEGESGIGKSTTGFITAMSLVCEDKIKQKNGSYEPCGECSACQDIIHERWSMDVIYKDCSDMGKQDVLDLERELERGAMYGENKVIILEESQALASKSAKGALLRVIEKKRANAYMILMTMDKKSFHKSVLDRCSVFSFKKFKTKEVSDYLMQLLFEIDPDEKLPETFENVITAIADSCDGSMRNALQTFQTCLDGEIYKEEDLVEELGITTDATLEKFLDKIINGDATAFYELGKGDSISSLFNKMWWILIDFKKACMTNNFYRESYQKTAQRFVSNPNFNGLLETFTKINTANSGYFNNNIFYSYMLQFIDSIGNNEPARIQETVVESTTDTKPPQKKRRGTLKK